MSLSTLSALSNKYLSATIAELKLLHQHLAEREMLCVDCIRKHFWMAEALLDQSNYNNILRKRKPILKDYRYWIHSLQKQFATLVPKDIEKVDKDKTDLFDIQKILRILIESMETKTRVPIRHKVAKGDMSPLGEPEYNIREFTKKLLLCEYAIAQLGIREDGTIKYKRLFSKQMPAVIDHLETGYSFLVEANVLDSDPTKRRHRDTIIDLMTLEKKFTGIVADLNVDDPKTILAFVAKIRDLRKKLVIQLFNWILEWKYP